MGSIRVVVFSGSGGGPGIADGGGEPSGGRHVEVLHWKGKKDGLRLAEFVADPWWCRLSGWSVQDGQRLGQRILEKVQAERKTPVAG